MRAGAGASHGRQELAGVRDIRRKIEFHISDGNLAMSGMWNFFEGYLSSGRGFS